MSAIAAKFGIRLPTLIAANPDITDPNNVKAGQTILIPPPGWAPSPTPS